VTAKKRGNRPRALMKRETPPRFRPADDLSATLDRADAIIHQGHSDQALELLLPLAEKYPRHADMICRRQPTWSALWANDR
jgi:hypothetical protein